MSRERIDAALAPAWTAEARVRTAGPDDRETHTQSSGPPLLAARLSAPPAPDPLLLRGRLLRLLDTASSTPVTLVSTPAGWGKTVLLGSWVRNRPGTPAAWLTIEPGDTVERLWAYLTAALRHRSPDDDGARPEKVDLTFPVGRDLPDRLAAELSSRAEPAILVLDDLHRLPDPELLGALEQLVRHSGERLRLVIGTRVDPALGLHHWRLRGELTEVRAAELAFTTEETRQLLADHGVDLPEAELRELWQRTEGWPVGLRLAALELRGHPDPARFVHGFTGGHPPVAEYLRAEVLAGTSDDVRDALRCGALTEQLTGGLLDALTGRGDGEQLLAGVARGLGFLGASPVGTTGYRYHRLLGDLLRAELQLWHPETIRVLHERAATWYAEHELPAAALRHALAAGQWTLARTVLLRRWPELVPYGRGPLRPPADGGAPAGGLRRGPGAGLPVAGGSGGPGGRTPTEAAVGDDPELALACATDRLLRADLAGADLAGADLAGADDWLALAERYAPGGGDPIRRQRYLLITAVLAVARAELVGDGEAIRQAVGRLGVPPGEPGPGAGRASGEPGDGPDGRRDRLAARAAAHTALGALRLASGDLSPAEAELDAGLRTAAEAGVERAALLCLSRLALVRAVRGRLRAAEQAARAVVGNLPEAAPGAAATGEAPAHLALALVALHRDRPDEAWSQLALADPPEAPDTGPVLAALRTLIRAELLRDAGDLTAARGVLAAGRRLMADRSRGDWLAHRLAVLDADVRAAQGDLGAARELLWSLPRDGEAGPPLAVTLARIHLRADDEREACRALPDWAPPAAGSWPLPVRLEAGLTDAVLAARDGDQRRAGRCLEQVLELAEPDGFRRVFTRGAPPVRDLLAAHLDSGTAHWSFLNMLLAATGAGATGEGQARDHPAVPAALAEALTTRELTILRYLQSILSNVEIAAELSLSVNTVKTHVRNIYRKLDATRRRDAVRRARELRLL